MKRYANFVGLWLLCLGCATVASAQSGVCRPFDFKLAPRFEAWTNSTVLVAANINGDSHTDLVTGNSVDRSISVYLGTPSGAYGPAQTFATPVDADAVALGDMNGDGNLDAVVGSNANVNQIAVLLHNGDAGFQNATSVAIPAGAQQVYDLEIADLNSDGNADLALVGVNNLVILRGNGTGGLVSSTTIPWTGRYGRIAKGDLNNDSITDIAFTRMEWFGQWAFGTVLGNAAGTYSVSNTVPLVAAPNGIEIGSFNGDALADVAISANYEFLPSITDPYFAQTWTGTGGGNFSAGARIGFPQKTAGLSIADFDVSGTQDLAVNLSSFIARVNGTGDGSFGAPAYWMSSGSDAIVAADANADSRRDVVALSKGSVSTLTVLITQSDGSLDTARPIIGGGDEIVAADMNNDGYNDLITTTTSENSVGSEILIGLNNQTGGFLPHSVTGTNRALTSLEVANINNDSNTDLFTTHGYFNRVEGWVGDGAGGLTILPAPAATSINAMEKVIPGNFNGDSNQDLLVITGGQGYIWLGNGNGTYQNLNYSLGMINYYVRPQLGDFNEDGKTDFVSPWQDQLKLYLGVGNGQFTLHSTFPIAGFESMVKGDFNGDGHLDIAAAGYGEAPYTFAIFKFFGDGTGSFGSSASATSIPGRAESITAGDFNSDGLDDVAVIGHGTEGSIGVLTSLATAPFFDTRVFFPVGGLSASNAEDRAEIVAADYNNDGKVDIGFTENGVSRGVLVNISDANTPCVSIDDVTVAESDVSQDVLFNVSLSRSTSSVVSLNYAIRDITATTGQDYPNRYGRLEIPAGQTSATITVPIVGDLLDEADEQFKVSISGVSNSGFLIKSSALGTIVDNDVQPTLTIGDVQITETQAGQSAVLNVALSAASGRPIEFRYATANGTATSGQDYSGVSTIKTIPAGEVATTVSIQIFTETMYELTEEFFVNLSEPANVTINDGQGIVTITDNDAVPTFSMTSGSVTEPDTGFVNRNVTLRLSNPTYLPVTGTVQTADGTATAGADYIAFNAPFTFAPGAIQLVAQIRILGDRINEANETLSANALSITNAEVTNSQAQIAIVDDDNSFFDFDGDSKTDIGIFRPSVGEWWINQSSTGQTFATGFGSTSDAIVPADYTGDGKADVAFWRPSSGDWFVLRSEDFSFFAFPFGTDGDIPVPADYDADGKADPAVFRSSTATWFIRRSSDTETTIQPFGANGDHPVAADYDGDGKADLAIFRPSNGQWWINRTTAGAIATTFGDGSDKPVQGDYTGDGKSDVAFWRPSSGDWFVLRSEDFSFFSFPFGTAGDTPAPGDYDGDGKFDATVFRPSNATWYSSRTTAGTLIKQFGQTGDRPLPSAFVP